MSKQYYCEFDKSVFSTEEELIKHIKDNYVQVFEGKINNVSDILTRLQKEFPDYEIQIKEGKGWYAQFIIELSKGGSTISQYYGSDKIGSDYSRSNPKEFDSLIEHIQEKINTYETIIKKVSERYNFAAFKFVSYDYGYSEDEHSYRFIFKVKEQDSWDTEEYYPYIEEIDEFINGLSKYFVRVLEGEPRVYHDYGYFIDYTIDGVRIEQMMSKKKVRLEVLED